MWRKVTAQTSLYRLLYLCFTSTRATSDQTLTQHHCAKADSSICSTQRPTPHMWTKAANNVD